MSLYFSGRSDHLELRIHDNGVGFDPAAVGPGHLGLSIMSDRIQNIGGTLETISQAGQGTLLKITWTAQSD